MKVMSVLSWLPEHPRVCRRGLAVLVAFVLTTLGGTGGVVAAPHDEVVSGYGRTIRFAGRDWLAKTSNVLVGPGPNYFSDSPDHIWLDDQDRLHLRIAPDASGNWQAAEVVLQASLGYGSYRFSLDSPAETLDPRAVLGLFTWNDDPTDNHRELDIELSRWSKPTGPNGLFSVQPYQTPGHTYSYEQSPGIAPSSHALRWQPGLASFSSWMGLRSPPPPDEALIASHSFTEGIPQPGGEQVRMNLWLDGGVPPTDFQPVEVIIAEFHFSGDPGATGTASRAVDAE
jgi:hypothetical protein